MSQDAEPFGERLQHLLAALLETRCDATHEELVDPDQPCREEDDRIQREADGHDEHQASPRDMPGRTSGQLDAGGEPGIEHRHNREKENDDGIERAIHHERRERRRERNRHQSREHVCAHQFTDAGG